MNERVPKVDIAHSAVCSDWWLASFSVYSMYYIFAMNFPWHLSMMEKFQPTLNDSSRPITECLLSPKAEVAVPRKQSSPPKSKATNFLHTAMSDRTVTFRPPRNAQSVHKPRVLFSRFRFPYEIYGRKLMRPRWITACTLIQACTFHIDR